MYKLKSFSKWAKPERLEDGELRAAVQELEQGLIGAHLGNGLYKKRVAKKGAGKRGGHRCLLAFKNQKRTIFLFGFSKSEKDNLSNEQLKLLKQLAKHYLALDEDEIIKLIKNGSLIEVK